MLRPADDPAAVRDVAPTRPVPGSPMDRGMLRAILALSVVAGTAMLLARAWPTRWPMVDDAWISARYAAQLAEGHGWVYNVGEHVEGFSNPGWTALLALLMRLSVAPAAAMAYAGLAHAVLIPAACLALAWALAGRREHPALALAPLMAGASPHVAVVVTNGLETGQWLLALLVVLTAAVACEGRKRWGAGALLGGLAWIRPEGLLVAAAVVAVDGWRPPAGQARADRLALAGGALLPVAAQLLWRAITFGALLPNTWAAKSSLSPGALWTVNVAYLGYDGLTWPLVAAGLVAACFVTRRWAPAAAGLAILAAAVQVMMWMPGARLVVPLWVLAASALAAAIAVAPPQRARALLAATVGGVTALWLTSVPGFVVRYTGWHSPVPNNPATLAARWVASVAPPGSTVAIRDAGVFAFWLGTSIRVAEIHPHALTVDHPHGARVRVRDVLHAPPEFVVVTSLRIGARRLPYRLDRDALELASYRRLGRVEQHRRRFYDVYVRDDLLVPPFPAELLVPEPAADLEAAGPGHELRDPP